MRRLAPIALVLCLVAGGCGGGESGGDGLRERVEERFAAEGVTLYEVVGFYGGGGADVNLAPENRGYLGNFVVHVLDGDKGFEIASAGADPADADGVHWTDSTATASNPAFIAVKRYGEDLALQMTFGRRSIDDPQWERLDAILRELAG